MKTTWACAVLLLLSLSLVLSGCASKTVEMLNARMGYMTYEEAIFRFGPPTQCADAGSTKTCTWVADQGATVIAPVGGMLLAIPQEPTTARLTFKDGKLVNWQLTGEWE